MTADPLVGFAKLVVFAAAGGAGWVCWWAACTWIDARRADADRRARRELERRRARVAAASWTRTTEVRR